MLKRFALYKLSQYLLDVDSNFGRERIRGTLTAMKMMKNLLNTPDEFLRQRYLELCQEVLDSERANREKE
jgi:hypothetical protein